MYGIQHLVNNINTSQTPPEKGLQSTSPQWLVTQPLTSQRVEGVGARGYGF